MAYKYFTGFEHDTTILAADGIVLASSPTISTAERHRTVSGRGGARSIQCNAAADKVTIPAFTVGAAEEIAFAVHHTAGAEWTVSFLNSFVAENVSVRLGTDGFLRVHRLAATILATSAAVLPSLTWTWVKIKCTAREAGSGGRVQVYINGDITPFVDTGAGVDCRSTTTDDFASVRLEAPTGTVYFDDYHQGGSGTIPDQALYVQTLRPDADAVPTDGTPSAGTDNFAVVDEDPISLLDYNEMLASGNEDRYTFPALGFTPLAVQAVRTLAHMTGEGTITLARGKVESNGVTQEGTDKAMQTGGTYGIIGDIFEINPDTGLAWTGAEVDAITAGYEVT